MWVVVKSFFFGLSLVLAFVLGNFLLWKKAKAKDFSPDVIFDLSLTSLMGGLIAGRFFYILANWQSEYKKFFKTVYITQFLKYF